MSSFSLPVELAGLEERVNQSSELDPAFYGLEEDAEPEEIFESKEGQPSVEPAMEVDGEESDENHEVEEGPGLEDGDAGSFVGDPDVKMRTINENVQKASTAVTLETEKQYRK